MEGCWFAWGCMEVLHGGVLVCKRLCCMQHCSISCCMAACNGSGPYPAIPNRLNLLVCHKY